MAGILDPVRHIETAVTRYFLLNAIIKTIS